jgi:hypothetical protein
MRRLLPPLLASVAVAAVAVAAVAGATPARRVPTTQHAARGVTPVLPGSVHVVRYQGFAAKTACHGSTCSGSGSAGPQFRLPASATPYRSTLTISFRYSAGGRSATFVVAPDIFPGPVSTRPTRRPVVSTSGRLQTATMVFRPGLLSGGVRYGLGISPDIVDYLTRARISVSQVVYGLDAWST